MPYTVLRPHQNKTQKHVRSCAISTNPPVKSIWTPINCNSSLSKIVVKPVCFCSNNYCLCCSSAFSATLSHVPKQCTQPPISQCCFCGHGKRQTATVEKRTLFLEFCRMSLAGAFSRVTVALLQAGRLALISKRRTQQVVPCLSCGFESFGRSLGLNEITTG